LEKPYGEGTPVHGTGSDAPDGFDGEKSGFLGEQVTCAAAAGGKTQGAGFLEITYGVLFEPTRTMAEMAQRPPLVQALLAVTLAGLAGSVAFSLALYRLAGGLEGSGAFTRAFLPAGLVLGLFWSYVKWAGASALLHLAAELLGGRGTARSVLAATGFAAIPSLLGRPQLHRGRYFDISRPGRINLDAGPAGYSLKRTALHFGFARPFGRF